MWNHKTCFPHYFLHNHSLSDIGMFGYTDANNSKKDSPEVQQIPLETTCMCKITKYLVTTTDTKTVNKLMA